MKTKISIQNIGKYLLELSIVVIGIGITLSINNWINQRLKSIEIRKELTDEWKSRGVQEGIEFAVLTDIITKTWSDKTTKEYI